MSEIEVLKKRIRRLQDEKKILKAENSVLKARIRILELNQKPTDAIGKDYWKAP